MNLLSLLIYLPRRFAFNFFQGFFIFWITLLICVILAVVFVETSLFPLIEGARGIPIAPFHRHQITFCTIQIVNACILLSVLYIFIQALHPTDLPCVEEETLKLYQGNATFYICSSGLLSFLFIAEASRIHEFILMKMLGKRLSSQLLSETLLLLSVIIFLLLIIYRSGCKLKQTRKNVTLDEFELLKKIKASQRSIGQHRTDRGIRNGLVPNWSLRDVQGSLDKLRRKGYVRRYKCQRGEICYRTTLRWWLYG